MGKTINLQCSIGDKQLHHKCIKSVEIQRNFSDVSNKFSMTLIDTPQTGLTDLELYMCAGNRTISLAYNDNPDTSGFVQFRGQIWDYTSSFVGNIKQLTISGYISRSVSYDTSGRALYNIDWNNYFCMRVNTREKWNINNMLVLDYARKASWLTRNMEAYGTDKSQYVMENQNVVVTKNFAALYNTNAVTVQIKGPGGSIKLPVPDTFAPMYLAGDKEGYSGDENDEDSMLWGVLGVKYVHPQTGAECEFIEEVKDKAGNVTHIKVRTEDPEGKPGAGKVILEVDPQTLDKYWVQDTDKYPDGTPIEGKGSIRAFQRAMDKPYIQLNPAKPYYGAGTFLQSSLGVDPSYIVKQLCKLEGWKYDDSTIVQTAMVVNSDSFKMNNQSALEFISEVLAPISITPVGVYYDKSGKKVQVKQGVAGFTAWFDEKDVFHYEPLSDVQNKKKNKTDIPLGYNIPDSPVISFQVDTKGTSFYTTNAVKVNSIYLTTGKEVESIDTTSADALDQYNKVKGHNENLDEFFGYTYEEIQKKYDKSDQSATNGLYIGFGNKSNYKIETNATEINGNLTSVDGDIKSTYVNIVSSAVQNNLVTNVASSAVADSTNIASQLKNAAENIKQFMITATMNMWGDTRIAPACIINVVNMVKSTDSDYTTKHPTSGEYLVLKQVDKISGDDYTQQLSLIRSNATLYDNINPQKIDFSKGVTIDETKIEKKDNEQPTEPEKPNNPTDAIVRARSEVLNLWNEYLKAIETKHPKWVWWEKGKYPTVDTDLWYGTFKANSQKSIWNSQIGFGTTIIPGNTGVISEVDSYKAVVWVALDSSGNPDYAPEVEAWLNKAKLRKSQNLLGEKVLHRPLTMKSQPSGIQYDLN